MKTVSIDTGASWNAGLRSWQDGDVFRETNTDLVIEDIQENFGYLYTQLGLRPLVSGANTWTSVQTFQPDGAWGSEPLSALFYREVRLVTYAVSPTEAATAGFLERIIIMDGAANETWNPVAEQFHVPTTTGNRTYKFNTPSGGAARKIKIVRPRTSDAHTVTVQDGSSVTMGVISASAAGWIELTYSTISAQGWIVTGYGGTVTSLATGVGP